ncbi:MAG: dihydrodipicolinate reductase [Paracoccaceae bacterium]|nr:dihydrodipicolinate reductase [Paracoccaceae bacterium]
MPVILIALLAMFALQAGPARADSFRTINDRDAFVDVIRDRTLNRLGITLRVSEAGQIIGRAFGRDVRGNWQWSDDGYFCRDLFYGEQALESNCQLVQIRGSTLRFTSDRGDGIYADLRLR